MRSEVLRARLRHSYFCHLKLYTFKPTRFKNKQKYKNDTVKNGDEFFLARMKVQWERVGGRKVLLGVNTGGRQSSCFRSVCSVLEVGFKMGFLYIHIHVTTCVHKSNLGQIRLALKFSELHAVREMPVFEFCSSECDCCM